MPPPTARRRLMRYSSMSSYRRGAVRREVMGGLGISRRIVSFNHGGRPTNNRATMDDASLPDEQAARRELAACYRLFDHLGWTEAIFNHITLRVPSADGTPHYLINPFGLHYTEVTAANLVKIDADGNDIDRSGRQVTR